MKSNSKRLQKLFIPGRHNNFKPSFFESKKTLISSLFIFALFVGLLNIQTILLSASPYSKLAAVLSSTLVQLTNDERSKVSLNTLTENELLTKAAILKAQDMATKGYFAHVSPEGKKPQNWVQDVGYVYQYAGENLAVNFTDSKDVALAWMNSPTHKANIVKPVYTEIGIGVATGTFEGKDTVFIAQVFASPYVEAPVTANVSDSFGGLSKPVYQFLEYLIYNNHDVINKVLLTILGLVVVALILKIAIHIRIQHSVLIVNALLLIAFISILLLINNFLQSKDQALFEYSTYEYTRTNK